MLGSNDVIAFVTTTRPDEARAFFSEVLGLRLVSDGPFALVYDANGTMLRVSKSRELHPAPHTVLGWRVDDVAASVRALAGRGVEFQRYDALVQDELGIWTGPDCTARVAWFKDPDGNTLSLTQF
jgi:catechol 2,3-dioxygenase-like lactoylglutathione lyase family enzyme